MTQVLLSIFISDSFIMAFKTQLLRIPRSKMPLEMRLWSMEVVFLTITALVSWERNSCQEVLVTQELNFWKDWKKQWIQIIFLRLAIWLIQNDLYVLLSYRISDLLSNIIVKYIENKLYFMMLYHYNLLL